MNRSSIVVRSVLAMSCSVDDCLSTFKLKHRDYQVKAIGELLESLKAGKDAALNLPTGTGKTIVFLSVANAATKNGYRIAISPQS